MADIDIVVPWVDGGDPAWLAEKRKYDGSSGDESTARFRDWDLLRYWFRGVETCAPWVRRIHFVTWGHLPAWLNTAHEKLHIVRHNDYIPAEYLPTFSSHVIELNLHRIPGLAEQFVYFNDDTFLLGSLPADYWFRGGLPCDQAIIGPYIGEFRGSIAGIACNDIEIINDHFSRGRAMREKPLNWFSPRYGKLNLFNLAALLWKPFSGLMYEHYPNAYLRSTFETVWREERDALHETCLRRFRDRRDVNQYLIRDWQLASNQFAPRRQKGYASAFTGDPEENIRAAVLSPRTRLLCLNDCSWVTDFETRQKMLTETFEKRFPQKSGFEI